MNQVRAKINERMDQLQAMMESNQHLANPVAVEDHIRTVTKFWSVLDEGDQDYIECARYAIEEKRAWKV
jgi:hypothetical protein